MYCACAGQTCIKHRTFQDCTCTWPVKTVHVHERSRLLMYMNVQECTCTWRFQTVHVHKRSRLYMYINVQGRTCTWTFKTVHVHERSRLYMYVKTTFTQKAIPCTNKLISNIMLFFSVYFTPHENSCPIYPSLECHMYVYHDTLSEIYGVSAHQHSYTNVYPRAVHKKFVTKTATLIAYKAQLMYVMFYLNYLSVQEWKRQLRKFMNKTHCPQNE